MGKRYPSFKEIIMPRCYKVPPFQRRYSWGKDEIDDLWEDIEDARKGHFMGNIVIVRRGSHAEIVDGQQRLASLLMLLCAVRDKLYEMSGEEKHSYADIIHDQYIQDKSRKTRNNEGFRLTLSKIDSPFFTDYILRHPKKDPLRKGRSSYSKKDSPESHQRMWKAFSRFQEKIKEKVFHKRKKFSAMKHLVTTVAERLTFNVIEAPSSEEAFLIFETLNDRGLELASPDLLKNYLLMKIDSSKTESVAHRWDDEMMKNLEIRGHNLAKEFLRQYWASKKSLVREKKLFKSIKKAIEDKSQKPEKLLNDIINYSQHYRDLQEPDIEDEDVGITLHFIQQLKAERCYPFLLSVKEYCNERLPEAARLAEVLTFRHGLYHGDMRKLERFFSEAAILIAKGKKFEQVCDQLKQKMKVTDEQFKEALKKPIEGKAFYLLQKIEYDNGGGEKILKSNKKVWVEHIMPQELSRDWIEELQKGGLSEEEVKEKHWNMRNLIGNLTLLSEKQNRKISNEPFSKKKDSYNKSDIRMNQAIVKKGKWGFEEIEERTEELVEQALRIWDVK